MQVKDLQDQAQSLQSVSCVALMQIYTAVLFPGTCTASARLDLDALSVFLFELNFRKRSQFLKYLQINS